MNIEYRTKNKEFRSGRIIVNHRYSSNFEIPCSLFDIRYSFEFEGEFKSPTT